MSDRCETTVCAPQRAQKSGLVSAGKSPGVVLAGRNGDRRRTSRVLPAVPLVGCKSQRVRRSPRLQATSPGRCGGRADECMVTRWGQSIRLQQSRQDTLWQSAAICVSMFE